MVIIKNFSTPEEIERGLMFIKKPLGKNRGALFKMENRVHSFWMRNTFIPLDIIFLNDKWEVVCLVKNAKPLDETNVGCNVISKYAIEVDSGYIEENGVKIGDKLSLEF